MFQPACYKQYVRVSSDVLFANLVLKSFTALLLFSHDKIWKLIIQAIYLFAFIVSCILKDQNCVGSEILRLCSSEIHGH